ncbi:synaptonemal complex protein 3-like [Meriones unguiculatus]|uniref:synaptonemal complex protein 3-like n=1 Tax=Meriones unguiculatus TaxID=10047 RepID=UPI00293E2116|nr:synaptonemal complex protein 3-like [Meriones unguiculatus]
MGVRISGATRSKEELGGARELSSPTESRGMQSPIELFMDAGEKVETILGKIGANVNTALSAKRHRMETAAQEAIEGIDQKMKQVWYSQEDALVKLNEDSAQSFIKLFEQWNLDFQKIREQHDKLIDDFKKQENIFQESRFIHMQSLRTIKNVHEQFLMDLDKLEEKNDELLAGAQNEIKEEMNKLQKKIMRESEQEQMANVQSP